MTKEKMNVTPPPSATPAAAGEAAVEEGGAGGGGGVLAGIAGKSRAWNRGDWDTEGGRRVSERRRPGTTTSSITLPSAVPLPPDGNNTTTTTMTQEKKGMEDDDDGGALLYGLEDVPPWYQCFLLGFQHFLIFIGGTIASPLALVGFMCITETDPGRGAIIATLIFVSGIITILQTTLGVRLPIIQGCNFAYLAPSISILTSSFPACHTLNLSNMTAAEQQEEWQIRMRELQGAIAVSATFQVILGFTGLVGMMMAWVTPLTIVPTITMLGLSLFSLGTLQAASCWPISALHLVLLVLVSQYLKNVGMPLLWYNADKGLHITWYPFFTYYPLLVVTVFSWILCEVLTTADLLPEGSTARTDHSGELLTNSPWFMIPYPGQWGMPTVGLGSVMGMMASVIASIIESIGDYNACAKMCRVGSPPSHAVTRGIGVEGLGCVLAGIFGTSSGTASYTSNIALIGLTKVGCRRMVLWSGGIMLGVGLLAKLCALFATIPEPVLGANLMFMFSLVTGIGLSTLRNVNLNSSRNHFVIGFSIFMGLAVPDWLTRHPDAIQTGVEMLDQGLMGLLQTNMFVGGILGLILDNTLPGSEEERGLTNWMYYQQAHCSKAAVSSSITKDSPEDICYNIPFGMDAITRWSWTKRVPFLPTFQGFMKTRKVGDISTMTPAEAAH